MTKKRTNRRFTDEFKQEAVRLALESGKSKAVIARELDSAESLLYGWIAKHIEASSSDSALSTGPNCQLPLN